MQNKYLTFLNLEKRPFQLFALMAALLFIASLVQSDKSVDVNLLDTYYVVSLKWLLKPLAMCLLLIWLIYTFTNDMLLSLRLMWAHIIMTTLALVILILAITFNIPYSTAPTRYYAFVEPAGAKNWTFVYAGMLITLFVAQLIFFINVLGGLFKRIRLSC